MTDGERKRLDALCVKLRDGRRLSVGQAIELRELKEAAERQRTPAKLAADAPVADGPRFRQRHPRRAGESAREYRRRLGALQRGQQRAARP